MIIRFLREKAVLLVILILAAFLRFYHLSELMPFGGDVARDYLAARDITLKGEIPLVGSPTSVPWLHQGAFFTYILGVVLWVGRYNPLSGGYFVGVFGVLGVLGIFILGKKFFSERVGFWAAFFYATSPLIVIFDRYPYHQSLISIFTLFFVFSLWKTVKNIKYFILSFFVFGLLMQLELSNLVLLPILLIWLYKYRKKLNFNLLLMSLVCFIFTWIPKIIYDLKNGYTQTLGFIGWVVHKLPLVSSLIGEQEMNLGLAGKLVAIFRFLSRIIFWPSVGVSTAVFILLTVFLLKDSLKEKFKGDFLLLLWIFAPVAGFLLQGSPSESYVPVLFGALALLLGKSVCLARRRLTRLIVGVLVVTTGIFNSYFLVVNNFFVKTEEKYIKEGAYSLGISYELNKKIAEFIVSDAGEKKYNLVALGDYDYFSSSILNTTYLSWYFGSEPSEEKENLKYYLYEKEDNIMVRRADLIKDFKYIMVARSN